MANVELAWQNPPQSGLALWNLGFRPFFLGACLFAVLAMAWWTALWTFHWQLPIQGVAPFLLHGREMIYGFAMAVVAGFLLTAVKNWTGVQTLHHLPLALVLTAWACARLLWFFGTRFALPATLADLAFLMGLCAAFAYPIFKVRQWRQLPILALLLLLTAGPLPFYLALSGRAPGADLAVVHGSIFLVLALVLIMGRRVVPFFIERGVGYPVQLVNPGWLDRIFMPLYFVLYATKAGRLHEDFASIVSALLGLLLLLRLKGWHTPGIWQKPLLWSLYLAFLHIAAGFLLAAATPYFHWLPSLDLHTFSFGGIGLVCLSMMARVSLGHTGRSIHEPAKLMVLALRLLTTGVALRVLAPMLLPAFYRWWILSAQLCWMLAFLLAFLVLLPLLTRPRVDGAYG
jgi:uncharacterized protein involved in response to NO